MKTNLNNKKTALGAIAVFLLLSISCSVGVEGYGVLLWPTDESQATAGAFVTVIEQSKLNKTYTITAEGTNQKLVLDSWRVKFYNGTGEAREFQKKFQEVKELWAFAQRNALPVRAEMNNNARSVYKLGKGEKIKVLEKASEKVKVGMLEGVWYKVLTKEGFEGYCFDAVLKLVNGTQAVAASADAAGDQYQTLFFENTWRPEYFKEMIKDQAIDIERFQAQYMLKPKPEEKTVLLTLPRDPKRDLNAINLTINYTEIVTINASQFRLEGKPSLTVEFKDRTKIFVRYKPAEGKPDVLQTFILLDEEKEVADMVSRELGRRQDLLNAITSKGGRLTSPGFGTLVIGGDKNFTWEDSEDGRVMSSLQIGQGGPFTGQVLFDKFTEKSAQGYSWVIHLKFNQASSLGKNKADKFFLYRLSDTEMVMVESRPESTGFFNNPAGGAVPMTFTFTP